MVKKRILGAVLLCSCLFAGTAYGAEAVTAQGSNTVILVDGAAQEIYPYNIDGNNYFKLRDMAAVLAGTDKSFAVEWDESKNAINLNTSNAYVLGENDLQFPAGALTAAAELSPVVLYCNGAELTIDAYNIDGNNYFKLRDIGEAVGFAVNWDEATQLMQIDTGSVGTASVTQGNYMYQGNADGSDILLDESFTNSDYWDNLPALDVVVEEEQEPSADAKEENTTMDTGTVSTDVQQLLNSAALQPKLTQFEILNELILNFMEQNFTDDMDTYTKAKVAYDYFINTMQYTTATQLDSSWFSAEELAVIWQHYPERYAIPILLDHKGVCNHYSSAYAAILQAIGLDVQVVSGKTKSSAGGYSSHVWVTVRIDGVDYLFDPQVEQRIAQRNGNVIQYYRFGKPVNQLLNDYQADSRYTFTEEN